jgi:hypothetical protein
MTNYFMVPFERDPDFFGREYAIHKIIQRLSSHDIHQRVALVGVKYANDFRDGEVRLTIRVGKHK